MSSNRKIATSLLLATFIGLLLIVILPHPAVNDVDERSFWIDKTFGGSASIIVGGDSRAFRGVNTNLIAKLGNVSAKNIGYSSAGFSTEYLDFLNSKIDTSKADRLIIIGVTPHSLTPNAFNNEQLIEYQSTKAFDRLSLKYFSSVLRLLPTYNAAELKRYFLNRTSEPVTLVQNFTESGWIGTSRDPVDSTLALQSYQRVFTNNLVSEENIDALISSSREIIKGGTNILAFRPPTSSQLRDLEDSLSGFDEGLVKQQLKEAGVVWIDFDHSKFTTYDGSHLEEKSADAFTRYLWDQAIAGLIRKVPSRLD